MAVNIKVGLCAFKDMKSAVKYYRELGLNRQEVEEKLKRNEIEMGEPELNLVRERPGFYLGVDQDGRYWYKHY